MSKKYAEMNYTELEQAARTTFKLEPGEQPWRILADVLRLGEREELILQKQAGAVVSVQYADNPVWSRVGSAPACMARLLNIKTGKLGPDEPEIIEAVVADPEPEPEPEPEEKKTSTRSRGGTKKDG